MATPRNAKPESSPSLNVLLVHHRKDIAEVCRPLLEKHGYAVDVLSPDTDAIRTIYKNQPDVVISGIQMPELNGYQLCRLLKSDPVTRGIPILLVSENQEKIDEFWSLKAGADDLLNADELPTRLLKKLLTVVDSYSRINRQKKAAAGKSSPPEIVNVQTRLNQLLDVALTETTLMNEFRAISDLVHNPGLLNYMLFSLLDSILEYDAAAIFYYDVGKGPYPLTFQLANGKRQTTEAIKTMSDAFVEDLKQRTENPDLHEGIHQEIIGAPEAEGKATAYKTVYTKDFYHEGEYIGSLRLYNVKKVDFEQIFPVRLIEHEIKWLMRVRHLYSKAEYYAIIDAATGLNNHKYFMQTLQSEFKSAKRYELDLTLALVEIGDFKSINEEFGFTTGDQVLKELADVGRKTFRGSDLIARYGSREMAVLFVQTPQEEAKNALSRLIENLDAIQLTVDGKKVPIKINAGMTSMTEGINGVDDLLAQAKAAVNASRDCGENRIEIYSPK